MNYDTARADDRLLQLLADRATEGLDARAKMELDTLLENQSHYRGDELDWSATVLDLAATPCATGSLPTALRDRVMAGAVDFFSAEQSESANFGSANAQYGRAPNRFAWYLAAASIVLAIAGWWQALNPTTEIEPRTAHYDRFLKEASDVVRGRWSGKVAGYENVSGEFAWSDEDQIGFMRFKDLPPNDPSVNQYQLWIVDPTRDEHPIDGGVFDVDSAQDAIVPIDAKLPVDRPSVFAITLEKPGGVVVSDGPLLVVGAVAS
ncbi:MAG: hypothetical protein DHS20C16_09650 [Phycisphaerae bacterium]|nr:MAG: hypothetical protein DHS20C16_09650 [Phycisphaerae bacterium]